MAVRLLSAKPSAEWVVAAAAEDGLAVAQFMFGMAYLEGEGMEKDDHAAYHWLRLAELNSTRVLEQIRCVISELKSNRLP